jgi:hypothetical protein
METILQSSFLVNEFGRSIVGLELRGLNGASIEIARCSAGRGHFFAVSRKAIRGRGLLALFLETRGAFTFQRNSLSIPSRRKPSLMSREVLQKSHPAKAMFREEALTQPNHDLFVFAACVKIPDQPKPRFPRRLSTLCLSKLSSARRRPAIKTSAIDGPGRHPASDARPSRP